MNFSDAVDITNVRRTNDGYLVAQSRVARIGVQDYLGSELGRPEVPVLRVYRPEAAVFAKDALKSYAHRPMTNDHPAQPVTADNWKDVAIGQTGADVAREGEFVTVPLVMMDAAAIKDFEAGKNQWSMGYAAEIVFEDGVTPEGEPYDAYMKSMRMNHLALVQQARGGEELRLGDSRAAEALKKARNNPEGGHDMADTRKILVDGLSIETTEQGAQVIEKLQKQLKDSGDSTKTLTDAHTAAIAAKDAELARKDAEIDGLKAKVLTDAAIDARVQARADLIATAKTIADGDYTGKSEGEIRKAAVVAKLGDAAVKDKADAYIAARFDILAEDSAKDPVRKHLQANDGRGNQNDNGQDAYVDRLTNAWKGANGKKEA